MTAGRTPIDPHTIGSPGRLVARFRKARNLTQAKVSDLLGGGSAIGRIEVDGLPISDEMLVRLVAVLDLSASEAVELQAAVAAQRRSVDVVGRMLELQARLDAMGARLDEIEGRAGRRHPPGLS